MVSKWHVVPRVMVLCSGTYHRSIVKCHPPNLHDFVLVQTCSNQRPQFAGGGGGDKDDQSPPRRNEIYQIEPNQKC